MALAATNRITQAFIVLNPVAGSSVAADVRAALEQHLAPEYWAYDIYETTGQERVEDIVRAALQRGVDLVVAVGGDGTISSVANGLAHTEVPLGIIPVGTANVLAQELDIPLDLAGACQLLAGEYAITCLDAMQVGEQLFVLHIGVGIDSLMIRDTERAAKRRFGRLAYVWTAVKWLIGYQPRRFTIVADGQRSRPRASQVLIANGGMLGMPLFRWGPDIHPDDGRIDVCIVNAQRAFDYLRVGWSLLRHQRRRNPRVRYLVAQQRIIIDSDHPLPVQGDGEIIGETPVQISVVPGAVRVIVPASHASPR